MSLLIVLPFVFAHSRMNDHLINALGRVHTLEEIWTGQKSYGYMESKFDHIFTLLFFVFI